LLEGANKGWVGIEGGGPEFGKENPPPIELSKSATVCPGGCRFTGDLDGDTGISENVMGGLGGVGGRCGEYVVVVWVVVWTCVFSSGLLEVDEVAFVSQPLLLV
jgi:hypothetical protein